DGIRAAALRDRDPRWFRGIRGLPRRASRAADAHDFDRGRTVGDDAPRAAERSPVARRLCRRRLRRGDRAAVRPPHRAEDRRGPYVGPRVRDDDWTGVAMRPRRWLAVT